MKRHGRNGFSAPPDAKDDDAFVEAVAEAAPPAPSERLASAPRPAAPPRPAAEFKAPETDVGWSRWPHGGRAPAGTERFRICFLFFLGWNLQNGARLGAYG